MGKRREGREAAVQFLYQRDLGSADEAIPRDEFWALRSGPEISKTAAQLRAFSEQLIAGVVAHLPEIDAHISRLAANYELHRLAAVDRNILRVSIYEMLHCTEVPPVVSINEAIEIAKRFGGEDSGRFVNGVLDRFRGELPRPAREGSRAPQP